MLRKLIFIFSIYSAFMLNGTLAQNYWLQQSSPTGRELMEVCFTDSLYGWAIGDSGAIAHTTNSGVNWSLQESGTTSAELKDIFFLNRNNGWIVYTDSAFKTVILRTTNSGLNWVSSFFPDSTMLFGTIFFTDISTGYISGYSGRIFKTTNTGASWFECAFDTTSCFYLLPKNDIYFTDPQTGYICGGVIDFQGIMLKTTNAGLNWSSLCVSGEPMNEIHYLGGSNIYVMGGDYDLGSMMVVTSNLGTNWIYDTTGCFGNATGFSFRTPAEVWAGLSFSGLFAVNLDSMRPGSRWQCLPTPDNTAINDIEFATPTKGWAVGTFGRIYRYNTDIIGISLNNSQPFSFQLYQNYPNPFNPSTVIRYSLPKTGLVTLTLYDITGREIKVLDKGIKQIGEHSIEINAGELASGVYFYTLRSGSFTESRKMALIK